MISRDFHFTATERKVAQAIVRGEGPGSLSKRLMIPVSRVQKHIHHMMDKTGTHSRAELAHLLEQDRIWHESDR